MLTTYNKKIPMLCKRLLPAFIMVIPLARFLRFAVMFHFGICLNVLFPHEKCINSPCTKNKQPCRLTIKATRLFTLEDPTRTCEPAAFRPPVTRSLVFYLRKQLELNVALLVKGKS